MEPILVIENDARDPVGILGDVIAARGVTTEVVRPYSGDTIPDPTEFGAVVVLGGSQGAYEAAIHPYLDDEMAAIRTAVAAGVPVLGICLGSQLIAHALGGRAYLAPTPEAGVIAPTITPEGADDPMAEFIAKPVLTFHQDTFDVPANATVIARSDRYVQAFRCGSALAIQPHPEVRIEDVEHWVETSTIPTRAGAVGEELMATMRRTVDESNALALFDAWLDEITD